MRHVRENGVSKYQFDSLPELSRWIKDTPRTWPVTIDSATKEGKRDSWDLSAGYDGAVRMARDGWLEGAQKLEQYLATLPPKDTAPNLVNDFYGHMPHVARYCAGAPDSMIRHTREGHNGSGRVLTLYVPVNANAYTTAPAMRNFGLGIAMAINALEQQGTRVELYGMYASAWFTGRGAPDVSHVWRIKDADQHLDLAILAFSIGHPAMFRRLGFALYERSDMHPCHSYGRSTKAKLSHLIDPPSGAYIINGMDEANSIASTPESALTYIEAQLSKMVEQQDAE